jgi:2-haloacid dehalogenase
MRFGARAGSRWLAEGRRIFCHQEQGVMKMLGAIHDVSITEADIDELRTGMLTMPAHPDVPSGLKQLKDAGFRLVMCTNSPPDPHASPLKHAGIDGSSF